METSYMHMVEETSHLLENQLRKQTQIACL